MVERRKISGGLGNWLFQYAYLHSQARKGEIPDIYVQDEKYFEPYKEEIKFLYGQGVEPIDMVSLHIRRGDYVNNPFYVDLTETDYYQKAVEQFPEETEFLVFCADRQEGSDDEKDREWCIKWIDENLPKRKYVFHVGKDEIDDFNTQAGCKGHITANSSFSWWSAYVGGGKTVCPSADKWFTDGNQRISLPDSWIKI